MRKMGIMVIVALIFSLVVGTILGGCESADTTKLKVVTSTALIAQIVERIGGNMVDVVNIIPPAQCPGHFDVSPNDIQKLADADLFLMHGWQGEKFTEELIASADNPDLTVVQINVSVGENTNWMTPEVQLAAVDKIVDTLTQEDNQNSTAYKDLADDYKGIITTKGNELETELAQKGLNSVNVMCNEQLNGFIQWTGLNIVAVYGRPDSLTPQVVKDLVDKGREEGVTLLIDNLQSGADAAKGIAEELGCVQITITNFPGGYDNTETWEKAIDYDVELILEAINK